MNIAIVTGSAGLIGAEAVRFLAAKGFSVIGIDNDMRKEFFGAEASTEWQRKRLEKEIPGYRHHSVDIRNYDKINSIFKEYSKDIKLIIHTAAQPSHDWAANDPFMDFSINANGTLNMLEAVRNNCPEAGNER
jgi:CDP-paratose 2-epimerase